MLDLPTLAEIELEERRRWPLRRFVQESWHVLESKTPLMWNWHIEALCDHVQALLEGWAEAQRTGIPPEVQDLLVNVPPGSMKSRVVSVCAPAWMWIRHPEWRALCLSANPRVAQRDSMLCRELIGSQWYRDTFRPTWEISENQDAKLLFKNTAGGFRAAFGFFSKVTGDRADCLLIDDPHDAAEVKSKAKREAVLEKYDDAIRSRVNDERISTRLLIMQRLHERDLAGHWLEIGDCDHLCIPQEYEPSRSRTTWIGWKDPRTTAGELMFPTRFTPAVVAKEKKKPARFAGQHQQRPSPAEGGKLKRAWWKRWKVLPKLKFTIQSWDLAQSDGEEASYVVGQLWGYAGPAELYLIDQVRAHLTPGGSYQAIKDATAKWTAKHGPHRRLIIENKASGPAVWERVRKIIPRAIPSNPKGSKEERVDAVSDAIEAGNVWIPDSSVPGAEWVADFIEETAAFPKSPHNDQVDTMTQALQDLLGRAASSEGYPVDPREGYSVHPLQL